MEGELGTTAESGKRETVVTEVEVVTVAEIGITAILVRGPLSRSVRDKLYALVPAGAQFRNAVLLAKRWGLTAVLASESWADRRYKMTVPPEGFKLQVV